MQLERLDHLVMTVANIELHARFIHGDGNAVVTFGLVESTGIRQQKINLHEHGKEFEQKRKFQLRFG